MLIALSTGTLHTCGLDRAFAFAAEAGFQGIEIVIDNRWDSRAPAYLRTLQQRHGIPVLSLHAPFFHVNGWPSDPIESLQRTVALAEELEARAVVVHLPRRFRMGSMYVLDLMPRPIQVPVPCSENGFARWLVHDLPAFQAGTPVTITLEYLPRRRFLGLNVPFWQFNTWDELAQFAHLNLDTTHVGTWEGDLLAVYEQHKDRIAHVHLSNYDGREHRLPMDGHLPLGEFLGRLARDGYAGIVCVEAGPAAFASDEEAVVRRQLREVFEFCQSSSRGAVP
ncbi:MAG: sugar phosphate isomerase/epimerase [Chloroflexi bacterium]|nr:sugar phosphate isomerase/epimerase [Chloroflexota bacterium]MBU1752212.1 sugar phosphate isomerase/epimerase [Chloroflexota bacterium]MBU1879493.1 sugar phosphate isomerase/epimerase [Chloroflexota bacterium]